MGPVSKRKRSWPQLKLIFLLRGSNLLHGIEWFQLEDGGTVIAGDPESRRRRGAGHSLICSVFGSNIPILLPRYSPNQRRSCESTEPLRGREFGVGVCHILIFPVFASMIPTLCLPKFMKYALLCESETTP